MVISAPSATPHETAFWLKKTGFTVVDELSTVRYCGNLLEKKAALELLLNGKTCFYICHDPRFKTKQPQGTPGWLS